MNTRKTACALPEAPQEEMQKELTLDPANPAEWDQAARRGAPHPGRDAR